MQKTEVRPGNGVAIDRARLAEPKSQLREGRYDPSPTIRTLVAIAAARPDTTKDEATALWNNKDNKVFRNAYVSGLIDNQWPNYDSLVAGESAGLYVVSYDTDGRSSLTPFATDALEGESARRIAGIIGQSNEDVLMHSLCQEVQADTYPFISGNPDLDREYFDRFQEMTDFADRLGITRRVLPVAAGTPANFIARGLVTIKVPFALPNLIDEVAEGAEIQLSPFQHRRAVHNAIEGFFPPYYRQPFEMTEGIATHLTRDLRTQEFESDSFTHTGDADNLIVYPKPEIVQAINETLGGVDLAVTTACPFYASRDGKLPLSRGLARVAFSQWDRWYYPQRIREYNAKM